MGEMDRGSRKQGQERRFWVIAGAEGVNLCTDGPADKAQRK
jgi:hypothetical protein